MMNKLYIYGGIALAVLMAFLKVWFMGYSKAKDEVKAKTQEIKNKALTNLVQAQNESKEALDHVKTKTSRNDFSSFNDD